MRTCSPDRLIIGGFAACGCPDVGLCTPTAQLAIGRLSEARYVGFDVLSPSLMTIYMQVSQRIGFVKWSP